MEFDQKKVLTLAGTVVLAGAVVVGGIYGPSAWKVFMNRASTDTDPIVVQAPPIEGSGETQNNGTEQSPPAESSNTTTSDVTNSDVTTGTTPVVTVSEPPGIGEAPQGDVSGPKKYKEPDTKDIDLAPSVASFFGDGALSQDAQTLAFGSAWNIHQYVDGYLYGPTGGPQMNEEDIKKYIVFHKSLWDQRIKSETGLENTGTFRHYYEVMLNRGMDAFDAKDKVRIEQFHQEIHDFDAHLMRNDTSAKIYGATPFATKR